MADGNFLKGFKTYNVASIWPNQLKLRKSGSNLLLHIVEVEFWQEEASWEDETVSP